MVWVRRILVATVALGLLLLSLGHVTLGGELYVSLKFAEVTGLETCIVLSNPQPDCTHGPSCFPTCEKHIAMFDTWWDILHAPRPLGLHVYDRYGFLAITVSRELLHLAAFVATFLAALEARWCLLGRAQQIGLCPHCRYDLRGNASGVCPECGAALEVRA